ncbi:MAG: DUF2298 domain-containing protein [Anaerolineae bacterium]
MFAVLLWWFVIQLMALAVWPLAWQLFGRLPGRGYPFAKALGLLLVSYLLWLGASLRVLPNHQGGIVTALLAVAAVSFWLGRAGWQVDAGGRRPLLLWLREQRGLVIATELLFLAVFVAWAALRAYNPEIAGTEKPMEFAFINGVLRSRFFPPQDPWLSGYAISYYYFGYVMLALLIRLTGVDPAVGFNLGVALWYALVMVTAFGVGYALVALAGVGRQRPGDRDQASGGGEGRGRAISFGLLAALFVGFIGNLEGVVEAGYHRGLLPLSFIRWLDIKQLTDTPPSGNWTGGFWWWWRASRVIHDKDLLGNSVEVIDEFPFFSFLLGDMHPHVLALPFALLAVALALNLLLAAGNRQPAHEPAGAEDGRRATGNSSGALRRLEHAARDLWRSLASLTVLGTPGIFLYALALGALGFLNTWDFPIYVGLAALALGAGPALQKGFSWGVAGRALAGAAVFGVLGWLLYLPFYIGFQSQLGGILPNLLFPSRFSQFFVMFGLFLTVVAFYLALLSVGRGRAVFGGFMRALPWTVLMPLVLLAAVVAGLLVLPNGRAYVQEVLNNPAVAANVADRSTRGLLGLVAQLRLATPWTWLVLALLIAWTAGVSGGVGAWGGGDAGRGRRGEEGTRGEAETWGRGDAGTRSEGAVSGLLVADLFVLLLIGVALLLALAPEFIYLRDLFGTRMNTVFKFYYQAWAMLALAAAYGLNRLMGRGVSPVLQVPGLALASLLCLLSLWYPLAAIPSKADNFRGQPTLDGLAYLRRYDPAQMAAIEWLRANVAPDAVVVEASGGSYTEAARVSMATGNPTLLGWDFHERQWRGNAGYDKAAAGRIEALDRIYRSARPEELRALLEQWGIDYVYIGAQERAKFGVGDAALARFDRVLRLVYDRDGVRIYAR